MVRVFPLVSPLRSSASRAAAVTTAGGPATTSAASATAPLPAGVRAADGFGLKGGGGNDGRRACDDDGRQRHGASPGGGEGRRRLRPQGWRRRRHPGATAKPLFVPVGDRDGSGDSLGSCEDLASPVRIHSCHALPRQGVPLGPNSDIKGGDWAVVVMRTSDKT